MSEEIVCCPTKDDKLHGMLFPNGETVFYLSSSQKAENEYLALVVPVMTLNRDMAQCLVLQLIDGYKFEPEDLFDQDDLITYAQDNFWDELHGH